MFPKAFAKKAVDEQQLLAAHDWDDLSDAERHKLLERLSSQASPAQILESPKQPKLKKQRNSLSIVEPKGWSVFLGEMVVTGYATTSDASLVAGNISLSLHRHAQSSASPGSTSKPGKSSKKSPFVRTGSAPAKAPNGNTIVRLRDRRGRDIGKLEAATSAFISKLLDWEWVCQCYSARKII
jgi:hypothetical protein